MILALFLHWMGIIIALGAVTVIDTLGFISRKSVPWTFVCIRAHHITMPLIWLGSLFVVFSWVFLYDGSHLAQLKTILLLILILNGCLLSLYISPRLDRHLPLKKVLPKGLRVPIVISMLISFSCWWSLVFITVLFSNL